MKYVGFLIGSKGVQADPDKIRAIIDFPSPKNITELRSFMGLVNQFANFTKEISNIAKSFRELLKTKNKF